MKIRSKLSSFCCGCYSKLRILSFLWLLFKNNLLSTRDNVEKRKNIDSDACLFCYEKESINHRFECAVAQSMDYNIDKNRSARFNFFVKI
jgi:hypothetical protein